MITLPGVVHPALSEVYNVATIIKNTNKKGAISFNIRVSCGYNYEGKQILKQMTWHPDPSLSPKQAEKQAQIEAILFENKVKSGKFMGRKVKFAVLADEWLDLVEQNRSLAVSTLERMKEMRDRTYKAIGHLPVDEIDFRTVQAFILSLSKDGINQRTGKGLSQKTQKHYLTFVSDVMRYAMKCGIIDRNPCIGVETTKSENKDIKVYTLDEEQTLLNALAEEAPIKYVVCIFFLAFCELRISEALGLEWHDIDFETGMFSIVRTSNYRNKATGVYTSGTKTKSSRRSIIAPPLLIQSLKKLKFEQNKQRVHCGDLWQESDRLFTQWDGKPMNPRTPYWWLSRFCAKHDLAFRGLHAFRHSFATNGIINAKIDVKTISAILGHSQTSTTLNIYAHAVQQANAAAIDQVAGLLNVSCSS